MQPELSVLICLGEGGLSKHQLLLKIAVMALFLATGCPSSQVYVNYVCYDCSHTPSLAHSTILEGLLSC